MKKPGFVRNAATLMSGTALSQIVAIVFAPVLSRMYAPADYGLLGLYLMFSGMLGMLTTMHYANAIPLAADDSECNALVKWSVQILLAVTLVVAAAAWSSRHWIADVLGCRELGAWLLVLPVSLFLTGTSAIFSNYALRHGQYGLLSTNRMGTAITGTGLSLLVGYFWHSSWGLLAGLLMGQAYGGLLLPARSLRLRHSRVADFARTEVAGVRHKFANFPKYSLPADFINNFTGQIPLLVLNALGSAATVGNFNMCNRILGLPSAFVSGAVGDVFRQRAARDYLEFGTCRAVFLATFRALALFSLVPFLLLLVFSPVVFPLVLGAKWHGAGEFARLLCPLFFFRFTISPLSHVVTIAGRQRISLLMDAYLFVSTAAIFLLNFQFGSTTKTALAAYAANYSASYLVTFLVAYRLSDSGTRPEPA